MVAVSVLVATVNPGSALPALVRSIDAQTLPAAEFELVVVDASSDGSADRLQQLAGRRPNVTVLTADADASEPDRLGLALERSTGEFVVVVGQQQRLAPRTLELLLERARGTGADLVLGRAVTGAASGCAALPDDADRLDPSGLVLSDCIAIVRRSLPAGRPDPGAALLDLPALAGDAGTVSALVRYACALQEEGPAAPGGQVSLEPPTYRWGDGMLHLEVQVRLSGTAAPDPRTWLVATNGMAEVALPAATAVDEADPATLTASAALDPRTAEGGRQLDEGPWDLLLRLAWPGREVTVPLPPGPARSAVLAGRPYVVRRTGHGLQLDVGATRSSVIGPLPTTRTTVAETVHGTLAVLDYPVVHVDGDAVLDARLLLDRFALPGRLVCRDGSARLEVYVGSLAGTSTVAVVAGGGKPVPTGLRLRVDGTGRMAFESVPRPTPGTQAASAGGGPLVQRLRRRLPGALEPVAHRLVRVRILRSAYRRLISR